MLAAILTAMQQSNAQLRESIKSDLSSVTSDLNASQAKFDQFQKSIKSDLNEKF
jgi:septal ring factor EnvC (AmiA/AmiB activator)